MACIHSVYTSITSESAECRNAKFKEVVYYFNFCLAIHSVDVRVVDELRGVG